MNECYFYMEPWNHDLESLLLQPLLCSTSNGTMWNHVEPTHCTRSPQELFNSVSKSLGLLCFHIGLCWMCITSDKRHHAVVLKCVAVSPERPCWDEKPTTHYKRGGNYGTRRICRVFTPKTGATR
jgi:hypothetical protein